MSDSAESTAGDKQYTADDFDWSNIRWPPEVQFVYKHCNNCGDVIAISPPASDSVAPSVYCDCDDNGPPYWTFAVEVDGEIIYKPGCEDLEVPF